MNCSNSPLQERELRSVILRLVVVGPGFLLGVLAVYACLPQGTSLWSTPLMTAGLALIFGSMAGLFWILRFRGERLLGRKQGTERGTDLALWGLASFALLCALGWMVFSFGALKLAGPDGHLLRLVVYVVLSGVGLVPGAIVGVRCWLLIGYMTLVMLAPPLWDRWVVGAETGWLSFLYVIYFFYLVVVSRKSHEITVGTVSAFQEAQERAGYYKNVIESVPGIVTILDRDLRYRMANHRLTSFFGLAEREIVGKPLGFLREDGFTALVREFASGGQASVQERRQLEGSREKMWFLVCLSRMNDGAILAVSLDIQSQVEAELRETDQRAQSEASARLAAVGEIAAGVAHEINNPLTIILSNAELVARSLPADSDVQRRIDKIKSMVARIARIAKSMKSLARDAHGDTAVSVKVSEVIDEVAAVFEERMRVEGIRFVKEADPALTVSGRSAHLSQMLFHLVDNAFDAVRGREGAEVRVGCRRDAGKVVIEVIDNGPGVPEAIRHRVMSPFFTTKPAGEGTGLGLSIAQRIAKEHGGGISLTEHGGRTCFAAGLPEAPHN